MFCLNEDGVTFVIKAGETFEVLHTNPLAEDDMGMATPIVVGDKLLIRTTARLYCIGDGRGGEVMAGVHRPRVEPRAGHPDGANDTPNAPTTPCTLIAVTQGLRVLFEYLDQRPVGILRVQVTVLPVRILRCWARARECRGDSK